jgi:hypothetical protein
VQEAGVCINMSEIGLLLYVVENVIGFILFCIIGILGRYLSIGMSTKPYTKLRVSNTILVLKIEVISQLNICNP